MKSVSAVHQNFINVFSDSTCEGHGSNRGKSAIDLITGKVLVPSASFVMAD